MIYCKDKRNGDHLEKSASFDFEIYDFFFNFYYISLVYVQIFFTHS